MMVHGCRSWDLFIVVLIGASSITNGIRVFRSVDVVNRRTDGRQRLDRAAAPNRDRAAGLKDDTVVVEAFFEHQRLDHFRLEDERTFRQRYFYSDRYVRWNASRQIGFLCIGGEGPDLDASVLIDSVHCSGDMLLSAQRLHRDYSQISIHLYALEHRYYGESYPFENATMAVMNEHIVYLSSRQALNDIATFISTQQATVVPSIQEWVAFGASYPGMLAAWSRLKFPHLVGSAVSNSAPIQVVLDFAAYKGHEARQLVNPHIGGSPECLLIFVQGHLQLMHAVKNKLRHDELAQQFGLCNVTNLQDSVSVRVWLGDGVYDLGTQVNDPSCAESLCNIGRTCRAAVRYYHQRLMNETTQEEAAMTTLSWLVRRQQHLREQDCIELNWNKTLEELADPVRGQVGGDRSWLWQTCTEVGFYQTCETVSTCPYARGYHPISVDFEICQFAFNVSATAVANAVVETNQYYGGWKLQGTRIVSITGEVDPWTEMALVDSQNPDLPVYSVLGASHHFWTHPVKKTDGPAIHAVRTYITETLRQWLNVAAIARQARAE